MKKKSTKLAKMENKRFSIYTNDLDKCYYCSYPKKDLHEIFGGCRRQTSIKYGLVVPVCRACHILIESNEDIKLKLKQKAEQKWLNYYKKTVEDFIKEFGKNYLEE